MSDSPARRLLKAKCTTPNKEEQNVCTAKLGPFKFNLYETFVVRESLSLASPTSDLFTSDHKSASARMFSQYRLTFEPANTPIAPGYLVGSYPASSSACEAVSSINRCCGSMNSASRGL